MTVYSVRSEEAIIKGMWPNRAIIGPSNIKFGKDEWVSIRSQRKLAVKRIKKRLRGENAQ